MAGKAASVTLRRRSPTFTTTPPRSGSFRELTGLLQGPAILFTAGFVGLVGSLVLVRTSAYGARASARAVPATWLAAAVIQSVASFGHALRGELPAFFVFSAVNAVQLLAVSLLWLGARRMKGHRVPGWVAVLPVAIWLAACLVPGFVENQRLRLTAFSVLVYGTAIWTALDLLAIYRRHRVQAALDMAVLIGIVAAVLMAVVAHLIVFPRTPDGPTAIFLTVPSLLTALFGATLPFLMLALTREWDAQEEGERRAAALRAGRAEVERLHAGLPTSVFLSVVTLDGDSVRIDCRYQAGDTASVFGWPEEEIAAMPDIGAIADTGQVPRTAQFRKAVETGEHAWEWRVRRKDGGWSWIRTRVRRLDRLPDGGTEVVGYSLNIDREREAEARAMAAGRLASLGEMAIGMAHEIRQPLQAISLAAEVAQLATQRGDTARVYDRLERIVGQTQRTSELIDHLRRFARGAEDGAPLRPVALADAIEGALQLAGSALRAERIEVEVALGDPAPAVQGQAVVLEQVLSNLLLNARDALAAAPPGAPRRVRIAAAPGPEGWVRLTVADTGGGIAPEIVPRLFEPFVTTKGPDKGTGLGLSICHGLVKGLGGRIEAHNDAGGAVFTITLRRADGEG